MLLFQKVTEEECELIENLSEPFGLKCGESDTLMDFKKKCADGSMLAYGILVGSKEKVMNDFSGNNLFVFCPNCREFIFRLINLCSVMLITWRTNL